MKVSLFYLPSIGSRAEIERGCAGLRGDLYGRMLAELAEQAKLADALGYDSISFTEHHFHVEGFELSNNLILLDLFVGMQTQRIRVGQLGIVLPADNPIRVAEDVAPVVRIIRGSRRTQTRALSPARPTSPAWRGADNADHRDGEPGPCAWARVGTAWA